MTYYYVKISSDLIDEIKKDDSRLPEGFRLVERWGPRGTHSECWSVEDEGAPADFKDHLVSVAFSHNYLTDETRVAERQIISVDGLD